MTFLRSAEKHYSRIIRNESPTDGNIYVRLVAVAFVFTFSTRGQPDVCLLFCATALQCPARAVMFFWVIEHTHKKNMQHTYNCGEWDIYWAFIADGVCWGIFLMQKIVFCLCNIQQTIYEWIANTCDEWTSNKTLIPLMKMLYVRFTNNKLQYNEWIWLKGTICCLKKIQSIYNFHKGNI